MSIFRFLLRVVFPFVIPNKIEKKEQKKNEYQIGSFLIFSVMENRSRFRITTFINHVLLFLSYALQSAILATEDRLKRTLKNEMYLSKLKIIMRHSCVCRWLKFYNGLCVPLNKCFFNCHNQMFYSTDVILLTCHYFHKNSINKSSGHIILFCIGGAYSIWNFWEFFF